MFKVTPTGYVISFKNGYDLSVAFGPGNYCSNRQETTLKGCRDARGMISATTAEAIVFMTGSNDAFDMTGMDIPGVDDYVRMGDGTGLSWASPEHIAALTAFVAALPMRADWKD